jgi:hypothetical protein
MTWPSHHITTRSFAGRHEAAAPGAMASVQRGAQNSRREIDYMPWVEIIETAARASSPGPLREALGYAAPELARVVTAFADMSHALRHAVKQ